MESYSERQLLMLSNFVYIPACVSTATVSEILNQYKDENGMFTSESVRGAGYGGGMNQEDVAALFSCMDEEIKTNPSFGELSASRILEENDVRAVCYTDKKDNSPVVAFRGTGGTKEAWKDNIEGLYKEDTRLQSVAYDFIKYECGEYESITVTGHSKGGNMAQYVTVKCSDKIEKCVSYDGQGFGTDFIRENATEIKKASPKIKSVNAYNDFVNILLFSVAGETVYLQNSSDIVKAHSSIDLLTQNIADDNGNYSQYRRQGFLAKGLDTATDALALLLKDMPAKDNEILSDVGASTITQAFEIDSQNALTQITGLFVGEAANIIYQKVRDTKAVSLGEEVLCVEKTTIYWDELEKCGKNLTDTIGKAASVKERLNEIKEDINYTIAAKIYAEKIVERAENSIEESIRNLEAYGKLLLEIADRYRERESAVASLFTT